MSDQGLRALLFAGVSLIAFVVCLERSTGQTSEIDSYEVAVRSQSKTEALNFIRAFVLVTWSTISSSLCRQMWLRAPPRQPARPVPSAADNASQRRDRRAIFVSQLERRLALTEAARAHISGQGTTKHHSLNDYPVQKFSHNATRSPPCDAPSRSSPSTPARAASPATT
jgi:hypothetical protein